VAADLDRDPRRPEPLEVPRERVGRRPNPARHEDGAVRAQDATVAIAIAEIDPDRDGLRRNLDVGRQLRAL
jgi:hypothetical protein